MLNLVLPQPTEEMLQMISNKYRSLWDFPNCVGAIDGKHIRIKAPKNSGSSYFNYKEFYSLVMLAIVDAENKFIAVDIGSYGREGDAGNYKIIVLISRLLNIRGVTIYFFVENFIKVPKRTAFNVDCATDFVAMIG